jgi:hypothetical protein
MTEHSSFSPSDFPLRDMHDFIVGYFIISAVFVGVGLFLEGLPDFRHGALPGGGLGLMGALILFAQKQRKIDIGALPQPSGEVRVKCDDPNCSLVEALKACREQTGLGLSEAKAVVEFYRSSKHHREPDATET